MKNCYFWATPSGPINLMKAEDMPVHPNNRVQVQRHEAEIRVIKDGEVVWQRDARADDYAWSNAENHAHHLKVKLMSEYESTLQAAKESSVPIQDQEKATKLISKKISPLLRLIKSDTIYGPFSLRYEIQERHSVRCAAHTSEALKKRGHVPGECTCKCEVVAILYDDTPEKDEDKEMAEAAKAHIRNAPTKTYRVAPEKEESQEDVAVRFAMYMSGKCTVGDQSFFREVFKKAYWKKHRIDN